MLVAQGTSIVMQAAYFIIVARVLGSEEYGAFVAVAALAAIFSPFVGLGINDLLIKNVSRDSVLFRQYWGNGLFLIGVTSAILLLFAILIEKVFLPNSVVSMLSVGLILIADLVGLRLVELCMAAFLASNKVKKAAQVKFLLSTSKLIAAIVLLASVGYATTDYWAILYCLSTLIAASVSILMVNQISTPVLNISLIKPSSLREGFHFSIAASSYVVSSNVDKTLLASLSTAEAAGIYSAAYRFVDVATVPLVAISGATYPKFFQHGAQGIKGSVSFAKRLLPFALLYGLAAMAGLLILTPFLPNILGKGYGASSEVLRWLSLVPLLLYLQVLAADSLTGAGFQGIRSFVQIMAAGANVLLNLWLIPLYSWRAATWSTLGTEAFKLICLWGIVVYFHHKQN